MADEVQQIKDRLSITDVVGQYVQLKKAGRNYSGRCPFHKERTPSFMVSPERGSYMCFGCGEKGDIFSFIERMEGVDFKTALRQLAERAGVKLAEYRGPAPAQKEKAERLREACEAATKFFEEELKKRMPDGMIYHTNPNLASYLEKRGLKPETIVSWRIGYAPAAWEELSKHLLAQGFTKDELVDAGLAVRSEKRAGEVFDRFRGRIMFPLFDPSGAVIAFSGRFFEKVAGSREEGEPAKYVNSPETELFKKSRALYGLDRAKAAMRKSDCILLVEGQFDVILSHQSGLPFTVAISGTALTPEHLSLLGRLSKRLVLALDNDEAGVRAGLKSAQMALAAGFDVKVPKIEGGKDPAELAAKDPELLRAAFRASVPAIAFFLEALRPSARDERAYQKVVEAQVLPLVAAIPSKIDQEHFVRVVAERLRVPEDAVREEVRKKPRAAESGPAPESPAPAAAEEELSLLEQKAGMLVFHFGPESAVAVRLAELVGKERLDFMKEKLAPRAEKLRFEFDALGEDETATSGELLEVIERLTVEEEIGRLREEVRSMERAGGDIAPLNKRLTELAKRRQELRH